MPTFYSDIDQFNDYLVTITAPVAGVRISGLLNNDTVSYQASANIGASTIAGGMEAGLKGLAQGAAGNLGNRRGMGLGGMASKVIADNFKTVLSTYKGYEDSDHSTFSINMHIFPNKLGNGGYNAITRNIGKLNLPNTEDDGFIKSYLYTPAMIKELAKGGDPFKGQLVTVTIGSWFMASGLFCTGAPPSFSKFVDDTGSPVFAEVDFGFTSYKVLNAQEWSSWWRT